VKLFEAGSLWSYKGFRLFWFSNTIFVLGSGAFPIALAVAVLDSNGNDPKSLGFILGARVLAAVLFAPIAGVWSDRFPRVQVMITADLFRAALVFSLVFLAQPGTPYSILALIVFLMGLGDALGAPASQAILPSLLPSDKLNAGNVARSIVVRTAHIIGPGVGAGAILLFGARYTFIFTGVFFVLGTSLMFFIQEDFKPIAQEYKQTFMVDLKEGVRTVWHIKWIFALIATTSFQLMFIVGVESVLLPVITRREFETNNVFAVSYWRTHFATPEDQTSGTILYPRIRTLKYDNLGFGISIFTVHRYCCVFLSRSFCWSMGSFLGCGSSERSSAGITRSRF
jgi:MFS family permease